MVHGELRIEMLGALQVKVGEETAVFRTDAERVLLAYLATHQGQPQRRDTLAGLLSPDRPDKEALTYLRNRLTRLRSFIGDDSATPPYLDSDRKQITLRTGEDIVIDVVQFAQGVAAVEMHPHRQLAGCPTCLARLEEAVALVRGEFLAGLNFPSETWQAWLTNQREHLQQQALAALTQLREAKMQLGEWTAVLHLAQRQLQLEPWLEAAHRAIMTAHAQLGDRAAALAQFAQCQQILGDELGVEPEEETTILWERMKEEGGILPSSFSLLPSSFSLLPFPFPGNLPHPTSPFFGREAEQTVLLQRLVDPNYRLVTLVGTGGIGKTRLAIEVGRQVQTSFPDGVWFVSLAAVQGGAEQIKIAVGEALGLAQDGKQLTGEQVLALLRDKQLLLILDNSEVALDDLAFIPEWLRRAPHIAILATSREPLNFQAESVVALAGLPLPMAEALFAERGQMARADFAVTAENLPQVRHICALVDGSPLGIGLAAAWVRRRSLAQIIAGISQSLDFLSTRLRDVDPRHRSVRAVFEASWQLLEAGEQEVLAALAVFPAGFTAVSAQAIAHATLFDLDTLCEKSLLQQQPEAQRYEMHSLLRQFAADKLAARTPEVERAFVAYFGQFAQENREEYAALQPEWGNLLTAVRQSHAHQLWPQTLSLVQTLDEPWFRQIRFSEMRQGLTLALDAAIALPDQPAQARLLLRLGEIETELNAYAAAEAHLAAGLAQFLRLEDGWGVAQAKYLLGRIRHEQFSQDAQALTLLHEAKTIFAEAG
ncbi:MAG: BTAD domain-containing putative transcriptional regulator, partial [Candidatus Promineifilaceae bacterium]